MDAMVGRNRPVVVRGGVGNREAPHPRRPPDPMGLGCRGSRDGRFAGAAVAGRHPGPGGRTAGGGADPAGAPGRDGLPRLDASLAGRRPHAGVGRAYLADGGDGSARHRAPGARGEVMEGRFAGESLRVLVPRHRSHGGRYPAPAHRSARVGPGRWRRRAAADPCSRRGAHSSRRRAASLPHDAAPACLPLESRSLAAASPPRSGHRAGL